MFLFIDKSDPDVLRIIDDAFPRKWIDMDRIASRCNVSRAALYVKFKKITGISPRQYREYAILRRAARLLENLDLSVSEIARQVGMNSRITSGSTTCPGCVSPSRWMHSIRLAKNSCVIVPFRIAC